MNNQAIKYTRKIFYYTTGDVCFVILYIKYL